MLALLEHHRQSPDDRFLQSAARGLAYYDANYLSRGRVGDDLLVFFANWQTQAARVLFEYARSVALNQQVADFAFRLHDRITGQGFYEEIGRDPARQVSVEVACALEGLNDAYTIAHAMGDARAAHYRKCICSGLAYLINLQCVRGEPKKERGGFGVSFSERAQRIDITGHVASAFMKSMENGIECEVPG